MAAFASPVGEYNTYASGHGSTDGDHTFYDDEWVTTTACSSNYSVCGYIDNRYYYYDGIRFQTLKKALAYRNAEMSQLFTLLLGNRYSPTIKQPCFNHRITNPRTCLSRRQIAVHKRKERIKKLYKE